MFEREPLPLGAFELLARRTRLLGFLPRQAFGVRALSRRALPFGESPFGLLARRAFAFRLGERRLFSRAQLDLAPVPRFAFGPRVLEQRLLAGDERALRRLARGELARGRGACGGERLLDAERFSVCV